MKDEKEQQITNVEAGAQSPPSEEDRPPQDDVRVTTKVRPPDRISDLESIAAPDIADLDSDLVCGCHPFLWLWPLVHCEYFISHA